ncbi:addiction module protein [Ornithinimicrobium ciconiae]|uniref:Addiction module protein n=1 Tax=Ornithinimicrobium ciconiae TaxID=2594265 RepID=A0A516GAT5_9MICO|nr:addiction module protein [Ornithinimicrobium ciconiae]QDO88636.1 addiction module protein [Ornithinimicrobium ciconiae]
MTSNLTEYIEAGKQFTRDERLEAAHQLLLSVQQDEGDESPNGAEWEAELLRRAQEALDGTPTLHDVGESHAKIRAELAATRRK